MCHPAMTQQVRAGGQAMSVRIRHLLAGCLLAGTMAGFVQAGSGTKKPAAEDGEFVIFFGAREIGSEKFAIQSAAESAMSTSVLEFRNPADAGQRVRMETKLEMDGNYVPRSYILKTDVNGMKGSITASFAPNQVMFDFEGNATSRRSGLLLPNRYTLLDSNIYHHFIFLVRRFDFDSKEKAQRFQVLVPQEEDSGILKISELRRAEMEVRGKKREMRVLQADSDALQLQLWVDKEGALQKISVPSKGLEVVRR
jgi:hypothetical protein